MPPRLRRPAALLSAYSCTRGSAREDCSCKPQMIHAEQDEQDEHDEQVEQERTIQDKHDEQNEQDENVEQDEHANTVNKVN